MKPIIFVLSFVLSFSLVFAQGTGSPAPTGSPSYKIAPGIRQIEKKAKDQFENLKKTQLQERFQKVKNEQKRKIVERVSQQLDELNVRMMNHFSAVLGRLEKVLANIVSRVDKAEANNWDVSAARAMITSAKEAIASARTAIEAQKAKNYTPEITGDEGKLKAEVGQARKVLHSDLVIVKEKVRAAYEFVKAVAKALAQSSRIDELKAPTPTPTPSQ